MPDRREGFDARDDGHPDTRLPTALHEVEEAAVVVEELRDDVLRAGVDLRLQGGDVGLGRRRLGVGLGIAGHADREAGVVALLHLAVDEFAPVHRRDLPHQPLGVGVSLRMGHEYPFVLRPVASQGQHVVQVEEVHVDQGVLDVVFRLAAADQVGHHLHLVAVADGGRDAHRARAAPDDVPLRRAVRPPGLLDPLAVAGDVDVGRIELHQGLDGLEDALFAVALQRRQQFEGESGAARNPGAVDQIEYVHGAMRCWAAGGGSRRASCGAVRRSPAAVSCRCGPPRSSCRRRASVRTAPLRAISCCCRSAASG